MVTKAILVSLVTLATAASSTTVATASSASSSSDGAPSAEALPKVVYTAHRGGALEVPENSMSGLTATFERGYAPVLDIDIRMLKDGTLVAMHDATLDRTTNMSGPVKALTLRDWRKVRIRPSPALSGRWVPERPPTLHEILKRFGGRTPLMLELKDPKGLDRMTAMLRGRKLTRSVYLNTNRLRLAVRAHRRGLLTAVWRSARQLPGDHPERWTRNVNILSIDYQTPAPHIRRAVRSGIHHIWAHTVNTPADRDRMLRLGARGIVTDVPGLLAGRPAVRQPLPR
ncbi:glycerophosphodiester phosphodiesterase [Streptomyces sp. NPDC048172]|uniref:glycerophosphodiester phosphodiesterase n=1 Tax=Streptomyces sp. NPDC048172 TaxID=3365505 RepID=UPI00371BA5AD